MTPRSNEGTSSREGIGEYFLYYVMAFNSLMVVFGVFCDKCKGWKGEKIKNQSVMFDAVESMGLLQGLPKTCPVLYVTSITAYSGVKDVLQGVLTEKPVAQHSHANSLLSCPQLPQLCNCVYPFLEAPQLLHQPLPLKTVTLDHPLQPGLVVLDEGNYPLPKVFGDILGLVAVLIDAFASTFPRGDCRGGLFLREIIFEAEGVLKRGVRRTLVGMIEEGVKDVLRRVVVSYFFELWQIGLLGI